MGAICCWGERCFGERISAPSPRLGFGDERPAGVVDPFEDRTPQTAVHSRDSQDLDHIAVTGRQLSREPVPVSPVGVLVDGAACGLVNSDRANGVRGGRQVTIGWLRNALVHDRRRCGACCLGAPGTGPRGGGVLAVVVAGTHDDFVFGAGREAGQG